MTTNHLIRGATFKPRGSEHVRYGQYPLGELLDMFQSHEASLQHDKVYALLGLTSDDLNIVDLSPNYETYWKDLFQALIRILLHEDIDIEASPNEAHALIKSAAVIIGRVSALRNDLREDGMQCVEIVCRDCGDSSSVGPAEKVERESLWNLRPSAKPVIEGDVICLFQGASKPVIIRIREDHCSIIQIAPTPPRDVYVNGMKVKWSKFERKMRRLPVRYMQCIWDWKTSPEELQDQGKFEKSSVDVCRVYGMWNSMGALEEAGAFREVGKLFRKLMSAYENSLREDELRDTIAEQLNHMNDVDVRYPSNSYALDSLTWAAGEGFLAVVDLLIKHDKASINVIDERGRTPLLCAVESGHLDVVERLLRENVVINSSPAMWTDPSFTKTVLQAAAGMGYLSIVDRLLQAGADVDAKPAVYMGRTALQAACEGGHIEVMERLLKEKADINAPASHTQGTTALQTAAWKGHLTIFELLLRAGADVNAEAAQYGGRTALQAAAGEGHLTIVELLLRAGADVNAKAALNWGKTALQAAAWGGHLMIVERLVEERADINAAAANEEGYIALDAAVVRGHLTIVDYLLQEGAEVNAVSLYGFTAISLAASMGRMDIVERLQQAGARG
jgi:ankyrin repeat protein